MRALRLWVRGAVRIFAIVAVVEFRVFSGCCFLAKSE